jgi:hypothetical protein
MGAFAVLYGVLRTAALFAVVALFFGPEFPHATSARRCCCSRSRRCRSSASAWSPRCCR